MKPSKAAQGWRLVKLHKAASLDEHTQAVCAALGMENLCLGSKILDVQRISKPCIPLLYIQTAQTVTAVWTEDFEDFKCSSDALLSYVL